MIQVNLIIENHFWIMCPFSATESLNDQFHYLIKEQIPSSIQPIKVPEWMQTNII